MAALAAKITVAMMLSHDRHHRNSPLDVVTELAASTAFEEGEVGANSHNNQQQEWLRRMKDGIKWQINKN